MADPLYDTDKMRYGYIRKYRELADKIGPWGRVIELGVAGGEGLRMFQHLFPHGEIIGVDSDEGCHWPPGTVKVIQNHAHPELPAEYPGPYDLIVDDGCHDGDTVITSLNNMWPTLKPGGYYVIEDWMVSLRDADVNHDERWGRKWDRGMLTMAESLLQRVDRQQGVDSIEYRFGLITLHKF